MNKRFIDQMRSWNVMREYFGIEQPGVAFVKLDFEKILPPEKQLVLADMGARFIDHEKKRIRMN